MKLPRRVPWANPSELEQICSWIYEAEEDIAAKVLAVNRLAAWKASTALPHALESTLLLLTAILQDENYSAASPHSSTLILRQSYSLALIRLVNGLVDPLQQGAFARPIASIAAQIGLPLWLVELRHASTHEELPSLELLREGSREAMSWLLRNYFLPTISPANQPAVCRVNLSSLSPLISKYKQLLKAITRDTSLRSHLKAQETQILRDIEEWVSEATVAASMVEFETESQYDEEDEKERWALERLCDALIGRGGLVPVSKRKRASHLQRLMLPATQHIALWSPLIQHLRSRYPDFPSTLLSCIIKQIIYPSQLTSTLSTINPVGDVPAIDPTYEHTLASWALWIIHRWSNDPGAGCERSEVVKKLLLSLSRADNKTILSLLATLSENDARLGERVNLLSKAIRPSSRVSVWEDNALDIMSERLSQLHPNLDLTGPLFPEEDNLADVNISHQKGPLVEAASGPNFKTRGWRLLDESLGWKPCPIGVYNLTDS